MTRSPTWVELTALVLGPLSTNCYILRCGGECWVVDPGIWPGPLVERLGVLSASPARVLITHGHFDHIAGIDELKAAFPEVRVCCPAADAAMLTSGELNMSAAFGVSSAVSPADELFEPGAVLTLGDSDWTVLDTSGHTQGGVSFYCAKAGVVLTGDALFADSIGRTDIPGGSASRLLRNIRHNLLTLPEETKVYPGHGEPSTIGREKRYNPFFAGKLE